MKLFYNVIVIIISVLIVATSCKKEPGTIVVEQELNLFSLEDMASWNFAAVPLRFAESNLTNNTGYGFNRAKIAWYNIDPSIFYNKSVNVRPPNLSKDDMSADDCRAIYVNELLPDKENQYNVPLAFNVFNIDFFPSERGSWNYDTQPSSYSAGMGYDGKLNNPTTRWSGITRKLDVTDYKINYIDFWLIDPFSTYPDAKGELYFDLGEISEDILKDGLLSAEHTTKGTPITSVWGLVQPLSNTNSFPAGEFSKFDTGLDELLNNDETAFFSAYLNEINAICDPAFYTSVYKDPANDDYHSYLGDDYTRLNYKVRDRYKNFNNEEQNSIPGTKSDEVIYQHSPNTEDINNNGILDTLNNYFEYKISIDKESFVAGTNYITDVFESGINSSIPLENGKKAKTKFYHFRIPLTDYSSSFGAPNLSLSPKFIRFYLTGFTSPLNLRFINLILSEGIIVYSHL